MVEMLSTIQHGLKSDAFASLETLELQVPTPHDVAVLAEALDYDAWQRLRHLRVAIVDATGPSGSPAYRKEEGNWDGDFELDDADSSGFYPSNWQIKHPNQRHQDKLFEFISSCRNLEVLEINATHFLDLDMLASMWSSNLKALSLERVWVSVPSLLELLSPPGGSGQRSNMFCVSLHDIRIRRDGGDWSVVFQHLRNHCPDLEFCHIHQLAYFDGHPCQEDECEAYDEFWSMNIAPDWESAEKQLWTLSPEDHCERDRLVECLRARVERAAF